MEKKKKWLDEILFFFDTIKRENTEEHILKEYLVSDITDMVVKNIFWSAKPIDEDDTEGEYESHEVEKQEEILENIENPQM